MLCTLAPWSYKRGKSEPKLTQILAQHFQGEAFTFASGREGLLALLKAMNVQEGDEIIIQGYTCVVLPNAIHAAGAIPIYVDIEKETLNLDVNAVKRAITPRTRAIMCQHTFGIPADTLHLRSLCDEHELLLIEDCAHYIPETTGGSEKVGRHGDVILLSFGRDKAISGISGGAIVSRTMSISDQLHSLYHDIGHVSFWTIFALLQYPFIYLVSRPFFGLMIGKALLVISRKLGLLVPILTEEEKEGQMPATMHRMPNALASIVLKQWQKLKAINDHRRIITGIYLEFAQKYHWPIIRSASASFALQKLPMFIYNAKGIREQLKKQSIHLDDGWAGCVICPESVDMKSTDYQWGDDPRAEEVCLQILSLPTHPTMTQRQARRLSKILIPLLMR